MSTPTEQLIIKQKREFPRIVEELLTHQRKRSHWAWYVWPTEKKGFSEPYPKTAVYIHTAGFLLANTDLKKWTEILKICNGLIEDNEGRLYGIIPRIDQPRIKYFLRFWLHSVRDVSQQYPAFWAELKRHQKYCS